MSVGIISAGLLAKTIDKVLDWYSRVLEIQKRRKELQELGAPTAETSAVKKFEHDLLEKEIRDLVKELLKEAHQKLDAGRRSELETHLTVSVRQIVRFVDAGGSLEVSSPTPTEPEEPKEPEAGQELSPQEQAELTKLRAKYQELRKGYEHLLAMAEMGAALRRLPERTEPILQIEDGDSSSEGADSEGGPRKK